MDLSGEYTIAAPREKVWQALNDAEILKQCVPGCDEIIKVSDTEFTAKVTSRIGPVKIKFTGRMTLSDLDPPNGYTISGEGQGGAAGFAKGAATVRLSDTGEGTILRYEVKATVGGKLAQIGSRLIDGAARKLSSEFFQTFADLLDSDTEAPPAEAPESPPPPEKSGMPRAAWYVGAIIVAAILLWVFV